jgi:hypothetical protein
MENQIPANEDSLHALSFAVKRSVRYHAKRSSFFYKLNQLNSLATIVLASAVMSSMMEGVKVYDVSLSMMTGFVAFVLASIVIVFDATGQAQKHHDLSRRFIELEKAMLKANPNQDDYAAWTKERLSIEAEDPHTLKVLDVICHNELVRAGEYGDDQMAHIGILQGWFAPFMDFRADTLKKNATTVQRS